MQTVKVPMEQLAQIIDLQLQNGGRATLTVTGSSMMPMLYHGRDSVVLVPVPARCAPGDIALYRRENGKYVLHRIIALEADGYICCGDNQAERERVEHTQLLAVVEGFVRKGKQYTLTHPGWRLYTWAQVRLFFLRRYYIALRRRLGRLRTGIKRTIGGRRHG